MTQSDDLGSPLEIEGMIIDRLVNLSHRYLVRTSIIKKRMWWIILHIEIRIRI